MFEKVWNMTVLAIAALIAATSAKAQGQQNCAARDIVVEQLATAYGETRQSIGLGQNNVVIEVFAAVDTGTWTITVTNTDGVTCLIASGQAFETLAEALPPGGEDA